MQDILNKIPDLIEMVALVLMALTIVATLVARITVSKKDDEYVLKAGSFILKAIAFLPTIGVNPRTKKLEEAYKDLKVENFELKVEAAKAL